MRYFIFMFVMLVVPEGATQTIGSFGFGDFERHSFRNTFVVSTCTAEGNRAGVCGDGSGNLSVGNIDQFIPQGTATLIFTPETPTRDGATPLLDDWPVYFLTAAHAIPDNGAFRDRGCSFPSFDVGTPTTDTQIIVSREYTGDSDAYQDGNSKARQKLTTREIILVADEVSFMNDICEEPASKVQPRKLFDLSVLRVTAGYLLQTEARSTVPVLQRMEYRDVLETLGAINYPDIAFRLPDVSTAPQDATGRPFGYFLGYPIADQRNSNRGPPHCDDLPSHLDLCKRRWQNRIARLTNANPIQVPLQEFFRYNNPSQLWGYEIPRHSIPTSSEATAGYSGSAIQFFIDGQLFVVGVVQEKDTKSCTETKQRFDADYCNKVNFTVLLNPIVREVFAYLPRGPRIRRLNERILTNSSPLNNADLFLLASLRDIELLWLASDWLNATNDASAVHTLFQLDRHSLVPPGHRGVHEGECVKSGVIARDRYGKGLPVSGSNSDDNDAPISACMATLLCGRRARNQVLRAHLIEHRPLLAQLFQSRGFDRIGSAISRC